jgi:23S rRNA pseudouridine1911/1915/1917 synthase
MQLLLPDYQIDEAFAHAAVATFKLETGRTHQIRVHAQHIGNPILGDPVYRGRILNRWSKGTEGRRLLDVCLKLIDRQALHARSIGFIHPETGRYMHFESQLPSDLQDVTDLLRKHYQ